MKRHAKASSAGSIEGTDSSRGLFRRALATRGAFDRSKGTGAPSVRLIAFLALAILAAALTAAPASADPPRAVTGPVSNVSYASAHVTGEADAGGFFGAARFEYSTDEVNWIPFSEFSGFPPSGTLEPVTPADVTGLKGGTKYFVRLTILDCGSGCGPIVAVSPPPYAEFETLPVQAPTVIKADDATEVGNITAKVSGEIERPANPDPAFDTNCAFEYVPDTAFKANGFQNAEQTPCGVESLTVPGEKKAVEVKLTELKSGIKYHLRLTAINAGPNASLEAANTFTTATLLATVKSAPGASDGKGGYTLQGVVNPHSSILSSCEFRYGPNVPYAYSAPCSPTPSDIDKPVTVEAHVTGLTPDANYHALLVVTNAAGSADGGDLIFVPTLAPPQNCPNEVLRAENSSLALSECRAYEMVSAPNKQGFAAQILTGYYEGNSLSYITKAGNIDNSGQGVAFGGNQYVSNRTSSGWKTIANLNGPTGSMFAPPLSVLYPSEPVVYSEDLQTSLYIMAPGGESIVDNRLYLRHPDGSFTLVGNGNNGPGSVGLHGTNILGNGGGALFVGVSSDLSHSVFNGTQSGGPVFGPGVYEFVGTGNEQPRRVDIDNSGDVLSACSFLDTGEVGMSAEGRAVSRDGRVIIFRVAGGCGGANPPAVGLWARVGGTTSVDVSASLCTRAAADPGGVCNAPADAHFKGAAKDGSRVYFTTTQQLVNGDTDETVDLYACDIPPGNLAPTGKANACSSLSQVSSGAATGASLDETNGFVANSKDGSSVYFVAQGVLAANEGVLGEPAASGDQNLYVWQKDAAHPAGETTFITRLDSNDLNSRSQATPDGRYLFTTTASQLVPTDTDNAVDVYRYDADTGEMTRASSNVFGVAGNGDGFDANISGGAVSNDGDAIVFSTAEALSPLDGNGESDAYLWKAGHVSLISTGSVGGALLGLPVMAGSGQDIYFQTDQELTPADGDDVSDFYDARVGGGFSFAQAQSCSGETCQPPASVPPPAPASATGGPGSEGNVKPVHCSKGKVAKGNRCVNKPHKKHHKKDKRAGHNHGGGK